MSEIVLLDGSIGQELVRREGSEPTPLWSTTAMSRRPDLLRGLYDDYLAAGATLITTNTYPILRDRLAPEGLAEDMPRLYRIAVEIARAARDAHGSGRVAGSLGPLGASYRPDLCPPPDEAARIYAEPAALLAPHVDLILLETMSSVAMAEGGLRAARETARPVWLAVSTMDDDGTRLRSGEPLEELGPVIDRHTPDAVLINCTRPECVADGLAALAGFGPPIGAYANGFTHIADAFLQDRPTVSALETRTDLTPAAYADFAMGWLALGATILGGCCEVGPTHIAEIARRLAADGHHVA